MLIPIKAGNRAAPTPAPDPLHEDARAALAVAQFNLRRGNVSGARRQTVQALRALAAAEKRELRTIDEAEHWLDQVIGRTA